VKDKRKRDRKPNEKDEKEKKGKYQRRPCLKCCSNA
jgi:hypothetical protein